MLSDSSKQFLDRLLACSGPSGFESETAAVYRDHLRGFCHEVRTDVMGNVIGVLNPAAPFKAMLAGHYDEIGFQVVHILDEGLLSFRPVGGVDRATLPGTEVVVLGHKGKIPGVIGKKPIHLVKEKERDTCPEIKDLWIDIGAEDKAAAEALVSVGDAVAPRPNATWLGASRLASKGLDDKIGAFVVAEATRELASRGLPIGVWCVGTVQEELGLRGAQAAAFGVAPDVGIAVDVGFAADVPDIPKKEYGDVRLGKGAVLSRSADVNPVLSRLMRDTAARCGIPVQLTAGHRASGGTDTAAIQLSRSGVATALVSVPNRYMHTPVEVCDIRDVESAIRLIVETLSALRPGQTFIPGVD